MGSINEVKQLAVADTPILFFQCVLSSGDSEYWSTHALSLNDQAYSARVLKHNLFGLQLASDDAMDGVSQISLTLANADSQLSELNAAIGFKGAQLTVYFAFADLPSGSITTEYTVLFRGVAGDPDEISENSLTLSFTNRLSLQRIPVPEVRIQRTCPWNFPASLEQRTEGSSDANQGKYSRFYRCGYSPDVTNGVGNLSSGKAFTTCDKSRGQCTERGMFDQDTNGNLTRRYGGFEFVPSAINVRTAGDKTSHISPLLDNSAKYNDPVPLVYGTGWLKAPVIFSRNDGNLTHMEALLGMGPVQNILKVVVNDVEIPQRVTGKDMSTTGWFQQITTGLRQGNFDLDFSDANGKPLGDPYGSLAVISIVVPNRISSGRSLPNVEVLLQGVQVDTYNADGSLQGNGFTNNPAWVILDLLRRCGWTPSDLNMASFANSATFCGELIRTTDLNGNPIQVPRYECNLILTKRQSAASIIRGIRVASSLMLRYGVNGLLELLPETTLAQQQADLPDGSNSTEQIAGGWPAYEFSDATGPFSGIARATDGSSSVTLSSRSIAETSNRLSVEFQDESNEYQQDSLSLVNSYDSALLGYEISSQSTALGIANFSQANRVLLRQLDKSIQGNLFIQFVTSFRALKIRPGDIIAITYAKEGFSRTPFRVTKLSPSMNYESVTVLAQIHNDDWYSDNPAVLMNAGRQPGSQIGTPRPLIGLVPHYDAQSNFEFFDFAVEETIQAQSDGSATDTLSVSFSQPTKPTPNSPHLPLLSLAPLYSNTNGTLVSGSNYYYAVTAVDGNGNEGTLSFTVPVSMPAGMNTVTIQGLSFPNSATSFNVYRGTTPQELYRIQSNLPLPPGGTFLDTGAPPQPVGPPDSSFDHANIYYRYERSAAFLASTYSSTTIGCADLGAIGVNYSGLVVRIIEGTGRNQERVISTNNETTLTVSPAWSIIPDATSTFVVAEGAWKFAAVSATSPARFELSYQAGITVQISGRGANVNNQEGTADLCPLTRIPLGAGNPDAGVAGVPQFTLSAQGGGELTVTNVGFTSLTNTSSVASGTLQIFYWNELVSSPFVLGTPLAVTDGTINVSEMASPGSAISIQAGDMLQVGSELMSVLGLSPDGSYSVVRGAFTTPVVVHNSGDSVLRLQSSVLILPFAAGFFESRASQNYVHTASLPDVRIAAAEFYVTNSFANSLANQQFYVTGTEGGLRTLSGGQFSTQVSGYLAAQQNAAPPLLVEQSHAVRDIRASLTQPSSGYDVMVDILQNGTVYCSLTILSGSTVSSSIVDGVSLPALQGGALLTMNVSMAPVSGFPTTPTPGRDLTVTIRF